MKAKLSEEWQMLFGCEYLTVYERDGQIIARSPYTKSPRKKVKPDRENPIRQF